MALFGALVLLGHASAAPGSQAQAAARNGPLALLATKVSQHKKDVTLRFEVERALPPMRDLRRYPTAIHSDQRHLCLLAKGTAIRDSLLCVGGPADGGRVRVGVSRIGKGGSLRKDHGFLARLKRPRPNVLQLGFKLKQAKLKPGHLRYAAISTWQGPECGQLQPEPEPGKRSQRGAPGSEPPGAEVCRSRAPRKGTKSARIYRLVPVGCSTGNKGSYVQGPTRRKRIALTFDDGPSSYTAEIVRILAHHGAHGTFFQVGNLVGGNDALLNSILARGNELANHSWAHEQLPSSSSMAKTNSAIKRATGFQPCTFRPPYGYFNSGTVAAARSNGLSTALWDIDTEDYKLPGSGAIYSRAVRAGRGGIVLMHDGGGNRSQTVAALPDIIRTLHSRGYKLVTVTELLGGHFKLAEKH